jgi:putative endonuclease
VSTTSSGQAAEAAVAERLERDGYKVIARNWKTPFAEIDIVAGKDGSVCFVEVKYRQTSTAGDGFDYVTAAKLHHMRRAAEAWVGEHKWTGPYELMAAAVTGPTHSFLIDIRPID